MNITDSLCKNLYIKLFNSVLYIPEEEVINAKRNVTDNWDSLGHMKLVVAIEETFNIMLSGEDVLKFNSFDSGINILSNYNLDISNHE